MLVRLRCDRGHGMNVKQKAEVGLPWSTQPTRFAIAVV
jgi:hypothetical protein